MKGHYVWAIFVENNFWVFRFWGKNGKWPYFASSEPKLFAKKDDVHEFLFKHAKKGRDIRRLRPYRIHITKDKVPPGWKWVKRYSKDTMPPKRNS